ncbi:Voltage-gated ion channel, partial [Globisporangium splendens]
MPPIGRVIPNGSAPVAVEGTGAAKYVVPCTITDKDASGGGTTTAEDSVKQQKNASPTATGTTDGGKVELLRKTSLLLPKSDTVRNGIHRESAFRSVGSLLLRSRVNGQINVLRTSLNEINESVRYHWALRPQSQLKTAWDLFSAVAVVYYSWMIPFMLCFDWVPRAKRTTVILRILDVWDALDVLLRFRTGITEYGNVVMNPTKIRSAYIRSIWFPIDLVSTIPFEYFFPGENVSTRKTIKYVKFPRLLRIGRFLKCVRRYKRYSSMVIALNAVLFAAHVADCIWVAVLQPCDGVQEQGPRCADGKDMHVYWITLHHGIVPLLGASAAHIESSDQFLSGGYHHNAADLLGDAVYLWSSFVSLIGAVLTAVLLGTVIQLVQSWNRAEYTFRKKVDHISHEMDALCLSKPLRARVNAYYDYLWVNDEGMSIALRQQVAIYLFKDYLQKIPFFQLGTDAVLGMICTQLHPVIFMPDDYIIREGDIGKELFTILKGIVRVMPPKSEAEDANSNPDHDTSEAKRILLGEGDFFGEIGVVMEVERTRSVKAECMAELCILSQEGFNKILVEFPEFATAMKRLIIKRVGEMWQSTDGTDRMEKMTKLADLKMKKTVQTYNNVQRLRAKTRVLQTLHPPRLSKLVSPTILPKPDELGFSRSSVGDKVRGVAEPSPALVPTVIDNNAPPRLAERIQTLENIFEDTTALSVLEEGEERVVDEATASNLGSGHQSDQKDHQREPTAISPAKDESPHRPAAAGNNEHKTSVKLRKMEKQLDQMEKRMKARLSDFGVQIAQILQMLTDSSKIPSNSSES